MGSPSSSSPRLVLLLAMTMIGFFVWAEVRARQQTNDRSLVRFDEPWFFAREAPPQSSLDFAPVELQNSSLPSAITPFTNTFQVSMVAVLPDHEAAVAVGKEVGELLQGLIDFYAQPAQTAHYQQLLTKEDRLPLTVVEDNFFTERGVKLQGIGIGWPGPHSTVTNTIQIIGPLLMIRGLKENLEDERHNPLETLLKQHTKEVLLENDRFGSGIIIADLTCRTATIAQADQLEETLQTYGSAPYYYYLRPPWQGPALSPQEVNARRTYRYLDKRMAELQNNAAFHRLETALYQYYQPDDPKREMARNLIYNYLRQIELKLLDELAQDSTLDATVIAQYRKTREGPWAEYEVAGMALGRSMGQAPLTVDSETNELMPSAEASDASAYLEAIHAEQNQLNLGYMIFDRFVTGFPALLHYLQTKGCSNFAFALTDFDKVRGN